MYIPAELDDFLRTYICSRESREKGAVGLRF